MLEEEVLRNEIKWHENNRGMTGNDDYEKGFLAGLRQALSLVSAQHSVHWTGGWACKKCGTKNGAHNIMCYSCKATRQ